MAGATNSMMVLPQYQGDYYTLQNKQALAQAMMQQAMTQQPIQATGSGQYTVMPKYNIGAGMAQLAQAVMAAKEQNQVSQGYRDLGQNQMNMLMGSPQSDPNAAAAQPQAQPQTSPPPDPSQNYSSSGGQLAAAMALQNQGGSQQAQSQPQQPQPQQAPQPQQLQGGLLAPGSALNPSGMDPGKAAYLMTTLGMEKYSEQYVAPYVKPTDATLMAKQAGISPQAANAGALQKANFIAPITGTGIFRDPTTLQPRAFSPDIPAGSTPLFDAQGNVAQVQPVAGAQGVMQGNAAATSAGSAQFKPVQVYNPQTQQMEYSNEAAVTNPSAPAPVRNNNPGAMMPGGKLAQYPDMQTGLAALDNNLASYGKQGVNTISGVISKWAPPGENNTGAYIKDVSQRLGVDPNQKIDLSNPLQRQAISTAISLHENGSQGVFGAPPGSSGAPAAAPPLGAEANANAQAQGQIETMQKSYQNLQTVRSGAPAALQDVQNMKQLAQGAMPQTLGPLGAKYAGLFSATAAEYEKSRDNLVTNLGSQLGINSDAARDLVYGSIPSYGAPKQAVQNGLNTLQGQIQTRLLKSDFLTTPYTSGDAKSYNQLENQFDQHITPAIANVVSMPSSPQRAIALKQAAQNPQIKANLEWAAQNGVLK